jgi:hypothetical protein
VPETEIREDELYKYTRYRWLYVSTSKIAELTFNLFLFKGGEPEKLAERSCKFNIQALLSIAISAAGNGARSCMLTQKSLLLNSPANMQIGTKLLKCIEGQYNKAFVLTMDNGSEVVAKLPNPNAGPAFYTTASEVATRQFVRGSIFEFSYLLTSRLSYERF